MSSFSAYAIIFGNIYVLHGAKTWLSLLSLCKWQYRMIHQASYNHGIIASCVLITDSFPLIVFVYQHTLKIKALPKRDREKARETEREREGKTKRDS